MKNSNKKYLVNLVLFFIIIFGFFSLFLKNSSAETTVWRYKTGGITNQIYGPFEKEEDCKENLSLYIKNNPLDTIVKNCESSKENIAHPIQSLRYKPVNDPVSVTPKVNVASHNTVYKLLAPFGGITCMDSSGENKECIGNNIGDYLNIIFKIAIGLCAVLAVIMLIINGITYMGDESIFGKTEAKKKMFSAIIGLLIALGSWAILNTINPALTGRDGLFVSSVNVEIETEPLTKNDPFVEGKKTTECQEGIVTARTVNGGIPICKNLEGKIVAMIAKAKADGLIIFGYGYRSVATQETLRAKNCGGSSNIYNEKAKCTPLTAIPGRSRHQNGLAIDFMCDGATIKSKDNKCFVWLKKHAKDYGLFNLETEPWHWSTDGS